jgi:prolyl-tRNA synthetase
MRYSKFFGKTKLTSPHDSDSINAKLLTQAGFVDKMAAGIYNYLPLGKRVLDKIIQIIREEMNAVEGQEISMPALHPIELWQQTGRDKTADAILYRTKGAGDKDFVFAPSHEEAVTPLAKKFIQSYKDLPISAYQFQTKFRNEPRAKSGVLRGREFGMKDMYSFHATEEDLDQYYERVKEAYLKVYERCGVKAYVVEASGGIFSDKISHEFSVVTPAGEDTILVCKKCNIAQNLEIAEGKIHNPHDPVEKELPMKEVKMERGPSVDENAKAHNVEASKILKSVVYKLQNGGLIGVCIRGDLQVNEHKLSKYLGQEVHPAGKEDLEAIGLVPGFISPVGLPKVKGGLKHAAEVYDTHEKGVKEIQHSKEGLHFIADHSIRDVKNFVTGANKKDLDLVNVNLGRDFTIDDFADFVSIRAGFACTKCGGKLEEVTAVEAGNIFKLGTKYSEAFDVNFTDIKGQRKLAIMGCYGIGTTRLVGTIVEASHDEKGIIWPKTVAPFSVHLIALGAGKDPEVKKKADNLYEVLLHEGVEVLYDDRDESAGKKFNDADLIGIPLRIVVSSRTLKEQNVEWKLRNEAEGKLVKYEASLKEIIEWVYGGCTCECGNC